MNSMTSFCNQIVHSSSLGGITAQWENRYKEAPVSSIYKVKPAQKERIFFFTNSTNGSRVSPRRFAPVASQPTSPSFLESSSMDDVYDKLANRLLKAAKEYTLKGQKYFVGLAGPPGAGKSTVARQVAQRVNAKWRKENCADEKEMDADVAADVPMDGFHLYRWQLDRFQDPTEAHARRGAPWTFDPASLVRHLARIKRQGWGYLPSFDHGRGDPVERDIFIGQNIQLVLVEGNYLLLETDEWEGLDQIFDEKWFIQVDLDEAMRRVENRHVATGKTREIAKWRIDYNDRPNAELIIKTKSKADIIVPSIPLE